VQEAVPEVARRLSIAENVFGDIFHESGVLHEGRRITTGCNRRGPRR
jgi:hypothetical protein